MFTSIINPEVSFSISKIAIITACSLVFGLMIAITYMLKGKYTKSYATTLVLLPAIVQIVIMMVNGNVGTGIAIAGAFSLIRFRSQPATSKEITTIFLAMAVGLSNAMGYLTFSFFMTVVFCVVLFILEHTCFGEKKVLAKNIRISIPENLDYMNVFDDIFSTYLKNVSLDKVKTTNMGSMFELTYSAEFLDESKQKEFMDAVRCRNGNLTVQVSKPSTDTDLL